MSDADDLLVALAAVVAAFRRLGVSHYVGGSVASTAHGAIRSTMDVDIVCDLRAEQVDAFVGLLGDASYVSRAAVHDAVARKSRFNLIHLPTAFKVDVFVSRGRPFDVEAMTRARPHSLGAPGEFAVPVATPEDTIVSKLEWFRLGDEASERQWDDVTRLVALHGPDLDAAYMRRMAGSLGVGDLLDRLLGG